MKLNRAKQILESYGYICEDTDELDDADLPVGVDPKEYHAQKAKQMSLTIKIEHALAQVKKEINDEADKYVQSIMAKMKGSVNEADARFSKKARSEDKFKAPRWARMQPDEVYGYEKAAADKLHHFDADNHGMIWLDAPNTIEMAKLAWMDGRQKRTGDRYLDIRDWKKKSYSAAKEKEWMADWDRLFAKQYAEMQKQIKKKGTVTIFRGTGIGEWRDGSLHKDDAHFDDTTDKSKLLTKFKLMLRNAKYRNSWSLNSNVAVDYAGDHEYRYLMVMEAYPYEYSLPFSAYLEGFWKGSGSWKKDYSANDEVNMFQSFKVRDIKIIALSETAQKFFRNATKTNCLLAKSTDRDDIAKLVSTMTFKEAYEEPDYMNGQLSAWDRARLEQGRAPRWAKRVIDQGAINKKAKELDHRVAGSSMPSEIAMRKVTDPAGRREPYRESDWRRDREWLIRGLETLKSKIENHLWFDYTDIGVENGHLSIVCGPSLVFNIENTGRGFRIRRAGGSIFDNHSKLCQNEKELIEWMSDEYHDAEEKGQIGNKE